MSAGFHHLQRLPLELQLMVFEEFIQAAQKPRIVLLDVEDCQVLDYDPYVDQEVPVLGWRLSVENREQLHSESSTVVARRLLAVCSSSRQVAKRLLDRPDPVPQAPEDFESLMWRSLSLSDDFFWLPDDLTWYNEAHRRPVAACGYSDEHRMKSIMISLDTFEDVLHWAQQRWEGHVEVSEATLALHFTLLGIINRHFESRSLVIMVDVPRQHVSLDQIQIVKATGRAPVEMSDEHSSARCNSALDKYEALRTHHMQTRSICIPNYNSNRPPWPELYFAFGGGQALIPRDEE